jgi:3-vinyl bacteriochlorophyllide hydratase
MSARPVGPTTHHSSTLWLYTPEQQARRDQSMWTLVQGLLAPLQFVVFLISLWLVLNFIFTGSGQQAAQLSIVAKTGVLYLIMITGSFWEKAVFQQWLFAPPFFWEDVVSMFVIALHTAYVVMLFGGLGTLDQQLFVALVAYASYLLNAGQFLRKFRMARHKDPAGCTSTNMAEGI